MCTSTSLQRRTSQNHESKNNKLAHNDRLVIDNGLGFVSSLTDSKAKWGLGQMKLLKETVIGPSDQGITIYRRFMKERGLYYSSSL